MAGRHLRADIYEDSPHGFLIAPYCVRLEPEQSLMVGSSNLEVREELSRRLSQMHVHGWREA